jgi:HSP20 family protein
MSLRNATVRDPDRLTARVFDSATRSSGCRLDAYREGDTFYIDIDLPGVDPAGIDVTADRKVLTVRVERKQGGRAAGRAIGTCSRQVPLSDSVDTDRLEAKYDDGVLTLRIPVIEQAAKPREADGELPAAA